MSVKLETSFLEGGGELGALIRARDWASTPLGPPERWPQSLRSAVSILLPSKAQIVLFWGPDLVTFYNDAYRPVFGMKHPGALGLPAREAWSELWHHGLGALFEGVLRTGEAFGAQNRLFILERHGYPEETYFDVSYDPVRDESGEVGGIFCIVSETTGRVLGERRLHTLRDLGVRTANARSAEEACTQSITSLAGNPYDIPFALLYLLTADETPPFPAGGTVDTHDLKDPALWPWAGVMADGSSHVVDVPAGLSPLPSGAWSRPPVQAAVLPLAGAGEVGTVGFLVVGLNPYRDFDEEYRGFLELVARQITAGIANARAYDEERKRAEALARIDQTKTAFFSNVSHEFRTPLTLMLGPLRDLLARSEDRPAAEREPVELAHRNALRLLKLVNTLLDFSRIEAGRLEATYEPTDLSGFTVELASVFRSTIETAGLRLVVDCPPLDTRVHVDREMWEKIVYNLLSNAFKFTFEGGIVVRIRAQSQSVVLTVSDTGTGIPAAELPHLFERFHRVKGARARTFDGSGIGLALVQELIRLHGGTVRVESTVDRGTTFFVTLPLGTAHLPSDRLSAAPTRTPVAPRSEAWLQEVAGWIPMSESETPPSHRSRPRILLADDNADMREYLRRLLSDHYEVEVVGDGAAALTAARRDPPDLILTDVMMPGMDGLELASRLRTEPQLKTVPVIMLSARAGEEARSEGWQAGADDYLVKPFSAGELLTRVAARLELSRLQQRVRHERAELADVMRQTPVPTAVMRGPDLIFEMANASFRAAVGDRDLIGQPLLAALPELEGQGIDQQLLEVIRSGKPHVKRERLIRLERGGQLENTYWTMAFAPLRDPDGEIQRVIVIGSEFTSEMQAREAIQRSETRYRTIFDVAGVAIWEEDFSEVKRALEALRESGVVDFRRYFAEHPEFVRQAIGMVRILDVNPAAFRMYGARDKQELLRSLHQIFLPETEPVFAEELLAIAEGKSSFGSEATGRNLQGERMDVLFTMAFPPSDPELRSVLVTVMDITERKRAERALREEAHTLETLYRLGQTLAAEPRVQCTVQSITDAATELSGARYGAFFYNGSSEAGEADMLYTSSGAPREVFDDVGLRYKTGLFASTFTGQAPVRLHDVTRDPRYSRKAPQRGPPEGPLPVRSYLAVPVVSRFGEVIGGLFLGHPEVGVFTERTERVVSGIAAQAAVAIDNARLHDQRLQLIDQLREADRRKDEFLATLSHELRNPLAPLRNSLHLLQLAGSGGPAAPIREMMERQVNHLVRLVDDLLEMSRISRGTFELRKERVALGSIIQNAIETSDPLIQNAGHRLTVVLPEENLWVDGDPVRLAQILANLLNNAAKYTEAGGEIRIVTRREGSGAIISVRDNGAGISPDALPRLFEMFSRGDRGTGRDQGGLGIGLALARRLVEMHGGSISATSDGIGRGSEFIVRLPLAANQSGEDDLSIAGAPAIPRKRILVVDDNRDSAESLGMLLEFLGADVKVALDGPGALEAYERYDPAVVLLDIGMPGMDGYEVARRIRTDFPNRDTAIVALTGWGQEEDRRRARAAGFDHHLIKPADVGALQALLGSLGGVPN